MNSSWDRENELLKKHNIVGSFDKLVARIKLSSLDFLKELCLKKGISIEDVTPDMVLEDV